MSLSLFDPFNTLSRISRFGDWNEDLWPMQQRLGRGAFFPQRQEQTMLVPKMDCFEKDDKLICQVELPGLDKDKVDITLQNDTLSVSGSTLDQKQYQDPASASWVSERRYGSFYRSFPVPAGTKESDLKAKMERGVLTIELPKDTEQTKTKRITIE